MALVEGLAGAPGRGITSLARTSGTGAPGTTDTYTVTYNDATTSTFTVTNGTDGRSITNVARTSGDGSAGSLDTYTITYSTGSPSTFQVRNGANGAAGRGITSIARTAGSGAAGTTDTYTVTFTDATTTTFTVTNGANGADGRGFTPRGAWVSGTTYAVDDIVTSAGSTYRRKTAGAGTTAPVDGATWELWAAKGADAAAGSGGGALLGSAVNYNPSSASVSSSNSTTASAVDSANLLVSGIVVPSTGRVRVHLGAQANASAAGGAYGWSIMSSTSTEIANTLRVLAPSTTYTRYDADIIVTGLTAGATITLYWGHRFAGSVATGRTAYGGNTGTYYGPATMEVYAA
ncbi:hypothetical protein [Nocardioides kribbensis]|uniref:hypothetical protein n=1 Tax=Nocardioides kribbensis TaxID=305517 RepID=UPI001879E4CB|nr:hypothetical protein [Nocardioides kribbensis]